MIPTTILGGFALLTSLAIPEVEHTAARGEARIELLGCLTRNFLGLEGALSSEAFRHEILSRCRPVLPVCSTANKCDAAHMEKVSPRTASLRPKSLSYARKAVGSRMSGRSQPRFAALKRWRFTTVLRAGNPTPEGRN